jgi:hypothetical protein
MRVVHQVRKVLGTVLAIACFCLALYALVRMVQGGSCASGGNYVSSRQCPPGTGWWAAELPLGIVGGLLMLGLGYIKFGREKPVVTVTHARPGSPFAAQMFTVDGERPAAWPAHLPWPPTRIDWQQATVVTMPNGGSAAWSGPGMPQSTGSPEADPDPLLRLERLRALRDANALTDAEYEAAKAKILSQM